jgi:hypothetical protein
MEKLIEVEIPVWHPLHHVKSKAYTGPPGQRAVLYLEPEAAEAFQSRLLEDALARTCVCDAWSSPEDCPACKEHS